LKYVTDAKSHSLCRFVNVILIQLIKLINLSS